MKILFICKYNRFRSKVAEAIFNKLNKSLNNQARSCGIVGGLVIDENLISLCKKQGVEISNPPQGLTHQLSMWADKIIVIEDRIPRELFSEEINNDKKQVEIWAISDLRIDEDERRRGVIQEIRKRVKNLLK